ncbi:MAG: hypothetical protein OEZ68_12415 [Gammaproteobacteria bacterium]|nr:hypothetical protein [Gammaproteobacteria bacterium]MDH5801599.1 hypothetical protein [Gammaproteobacteria bacterium]
MSTSLILQVKQVTELSAASKLQISRQIKHWSGASARLRKFDRLISKEAFLGIEKYLGVAVWDTLNGAVDRLQNRATRMQERFKSCRSNHDFRNIQRELIDFRKRYLRTETTVDFYADAISTRTNSLMASMLGACDILSYRAMANILEPLGKPTPLTLTYIDKGLGASILKAGLRLWDGNTESPAAAIKIVHHNFERPTALIHESGHQIAHITGWNQELNQALENSIQDYEIAPIWASWASEIAADAIAFAYTGYASVAGLHDVLSGDSSFVFRFKPDDPHPISYIRILLGICMCRRFYGAGPWDDMEKSWVSTYPLPHENSMSKHIITRSLNALPSIVETILLTPMRCFNGRALTDLINPLDVSPKSLYRLEQRLGGSLYTSTHWLWTECLRLLALSGLNIATMREPETELNQQESWMLRLGKTATV